mmetsp:Transcript_7482/g.6778  ORF Transcript_7482/g.6778 Transcript_7482/m.6778 type:complete len:195 (-) Transcript_7482:1275-1859(-)
MNISYENSFSAIKKDILKETVDKKRHNALNKEVIPIDEKPNKPKDKLIVHNMSSNASGSDQIQGIGSGMNIQDEQDEGRAHKHHKELGNSLNEPELVQKKNASLNESQLNHLREKTPAVGASSQTTSVSGQMALQGMERPKTSHHTVQNSTVIHHNRQNNNSLSVNNGVITQTNHYNTNAKKLHETQRVASTNN